MSLTNEEILAVLTELKPPDFKIDILKDAWYSPKALLRAVGDKHHEEYPLVAVVRVLLNSGVLELHPTDDDRVEIKCYCCFGGDPDKGIYPLEDLPKAIAALKDHECPYFPG